MTSKITLKAGEAKAVTFTVTSAGVAVNLTDATFTFIMKHYKTDSNIVVNKQDASFNKAQVSLGIVSVVLSAVDTNKPEGEYVGELKIEFSPTNIDKSDDIIFKIVNSVMA